MGVLLKGLFGSTLGLAVVAAIAAMIYAGVKSHDSGVIAKHELKAERKIASHAKSANQIRSATSAVPSNNLRDDWTRD